LDHEILSHNENGVMNMQYGMIDDAQHYFVKALDCYTVKHRESTSHQDGEVRGNVNELGRPPFVTPSPESCDSNLHQARATATSTLQAPSLNKAQEYDEGVRIYIDTMAFSEGVSDSMQSASLYYNVAQTFVHLQKYNEAMSWFELAMACIKLLPTNDTIATAAVKIRHNLGYCCYRLAKSQEAQYCFKKALDMAEQLRLGLPYTAAARTAYAVVLFYNASTNDKTLDLLLQSLVEYKSVFGNESLEVAAVLNNIGRVHFAEGSFHDAIQFYNESLSIRRKLLSEVSIDIAATICNTGQTLHRIGELHGALLLYEEFLALATSGEYNNRDVAIISKSAGEIYHKQGDLAKAKSLYEQALKAGCTGFGNNHAEVASIYNRLGNLYYEANDLTKALGCYKKGLTIEQLTLPACHARIVVTIANIAQIYYQMEEFPLALARYNQVFMIQLKSHGPTSLEVAKALATMAEMEYKMRNFDAAFTIFQDVLVIQRDHCSENEDGLEIASTLNSIGIVACAQGEFKIAQGCFDSSLKVRRKELGDHKDTATLWYNLATVNEETGDEDKAIAMYKECLRIERNILDSGKKCDVVDSLQRLGRLYQRRGELEEASQYFREALKSLRNSGEDATFAVAKFLNLIGNIHLQRAEICEMMDCYAEASRIYRDAASRTSPPNEVLVIAGYFMYGLSKLHPLSAASA
jgi:tetratricopeptide (TPR) repeat protein